jgi:hypothetical protein
MGGLAGPDENGMSAERMEEISTLNNQAAELPDGAYYAFMEEHGVSAEELEAYSEWCTARDKGDGKMLEVDFRNFREGRVPGEINNFSALLFLLIAKADAENRRRISAVYPSHVEMYENWLNSPTPRR